VNKTQLSVALVAALSLMLIAAAPEKGSDEPTYTKDGKLIRPENYRDWVYLSSGLGMSYATRADDPNPAFTNVFVTRAAYDGFLRSGKWPEKTMFIIEERNSSSKGSINKVGHYQADVAGYAMEVKDSSRFPDTWAYFGFGPSDTTSAPMTPSKNVCWSCHNSNGAVEQTFVQFYPTLKPVAQKFGTYKEGAEAPK
jgi:hypothetical protein